MIIFLENPCKNVNRRQFVWKTLVKHLADDNLKNKSYKFVSDDGVVRRLMKLVADDNLLNNVLLADDTFYVGNTLVRLLAALAGKSLVKLLSDDVRLFILLIGRSFSIALL